ncbi:MAG: hypothetical protein LBU25_04220 [Treponema sp.]|jgi:hypothetical protein|nr:hypothetical protein [Treponema sp.]
MTTETCRVFIMGYTFPYDPAVSETDKEPLSPYADLETLERIASDHRYVHWKVARFFALNELDDSRADNGWENTWLSEYPLIIYHADTGAPRYYEFRVIREGTEIGAITGVAEKTEGIPIQFVLPFANELAGENARAVTTGSKKLLDTAYPGRLLMEGATLGRSVDAATGAEDTTVYPAGMKGADFLETASQEQLAAFGISTEELYQQYRSAEEEKLRELAVFWEEVDGLTGNILAMSEEELRDTFGDEAAQARGVSTSYSDTYLLNDWYSKEKWAAAPGYCGPNVIAFTMLGLGTKSGHPGIPTTNNKSQLEAYYRAVESRMGKGPKLYYWFDGDSLDGWLRTLTGGRYRLGAHWGIPLILDHSWNAINASIRGNTLPAISLRWPKIESPAGGFHYRTVIGTRRANTSLSFKVLWWTVRLPLWSYGQYRMHDNGADGQYWWEGPSLYQFQAARVIKN